MRINQSYQNLMKSFSSFDTAQKEAASKSATQKGRPDTSAFSKTPGGAPGGTPMPVEPDGGIGDGAGPIPGTPKGGETPSGAKGGNCGSPGDMGFGTTQALGKENGGTPMPVEPDGGIGDGAGPIPGTPIPVEPDGGIGDGAGPIPGTPIPVEPDGGIGDGAGPIPVDPDGPPIATTLAIGEEDGGGGPIPAPPPIGGEPGRDGDVITGTKGDDVLDGTNGDDLIRGRAGNDFITTGQGTDTVRGGRGDDTITVTGTGDKKINGGKGHDTLELKGQESDYAIRTRNSGSTVYTSPNGSRIVARNIESVSFLGNVTPEPPTNPDFIAFYALAPNDLGATSLEITGDTAVLTGPNTDFTFTGIDPSGLAFDGPLIATGGSGTINGEQTTAVPLSPFGDAVLTIGSGFNPTGTQGVSAAFANGDTLNTTVEATALP